MTFKMYHFRIQMTTSVCLHVSMFGGGEAADVKTTDLRQQMATQYGGQKTFLVTGVNCGALFT